MFQSRARWAAAILLGLTISVVTPGCLTTMAVKYAYKKYETAKERKEEKKQEQMARQQQPPPPQVQGTTQ